MIIRFVLLSLLNIITGLIFLYSAYTKLYPIEPFELIFVEIKIANWATAPFIARLFISIEFFIGLMLISNFSTKLFSKLAIIILIIFSIYLTALLVKDGNNGNCGCFGTHIIMTPLQALIKNILMIMALCLVYFFHKGFQWSKIKYLIILNALISLSIPHILNYVELSYSQKYLTKNEHIHPLGLDTLFKYAQIHKPPKELSQGKHIIAFMSLTCPHCRIAAKKMRLMKESNTKLPFYFVLNGDEKDLKPFFNDTKADNIPYCMLLGKPFVYMAGLRMPAIFLVKNDTVVNKIDYISLQQSEIEKWLNE